ncbi:hypothetical protein PIB30_070056 [Stylosanthes scabra]|uniref:Uncharacterized protein n=1 Tax=Stylosanthes scabra TaxID=79078 RepID=A0ABU6ZM02_9FABA|nr:hypothetical protein [Stylosanthes scabra]
MPQHPQNLKSSPHSKLPSLIHVLLENKNMTSPYTTSRPRLSHGNKDKQSLNFDPEIERTLRKLRKQFSDNVTAKEVLEEGRANMAEAGNQRRTLADFTNPTTASCGSIIVDAANLFTKTIRNNPTSASDQVVIH